MSEVVRHLVELACLVAASLTWMFIKDRAGVLVLALLIGAGVFMAGRFCSWLRRELPDPRGAGDAAIYCLGLLACVASIFAAAATYAIGHAGEALAVSVSQFTKDSFSAKASAWQRSTLEASAGRVAALGEGREVAASLVLRGAMSLPITDTEAATVVGDQYVRQSLRRFGEERDWKFALWSRWVIAETPEAESRIQEVVAALPKGKTTVSGDPAAPPLTADAVAMAGGILSWCIAAGIEEYLEIRLFELWLPVILLWIFTLGLMAATARLRFDKSLATLSRMP